MSHMQYTALLPMYFDSCASFLCMYFLNGKNYSGPFSNCKSLAV